MGHERRDTRDFYDKVKIMVREEFDLEAEFVDFNGLRENSKCQRLIS